MKTFKHIFLITLGVVFGLLALIYGILNTHTVQEYARGILVNELRKKIDSNLEIKALYFRPFNTVELDSIYLFDKESQQILFADNVSASIDLFELVKKDVVISSARLSDFEIKLWKQSSDSALNIKFIIDAFKSKDQKPKGKINFKISSLVLDNGNFYYDILDKPQTTSDKFDSNHIGVHNLEAKLALKSLSSDSLNLQVRKLSLNEQSGFKISNLTAKLTTQGENFSLKGFQLFLPNSKVQLDRLNLFLPQKQEQDSNDVHNHETDDPRIDLVLSESYIEPADIASFVPQLKHFDDKVNIEIRAKGRLHDLKLSKLVLTFGHKLELTANGELIDGFGGEHTYLKASIDHLKSSGVDLENLINCFSAKEVNLPKGIRGQHQILFQSNISGYLDHLETTALLKTDNGFIETGATIGFDAKEKKFTYAKGRIQTTAFQLGSFLTQKDLGNISFNLDVDIKKPLNNDLIANLTGTITDFGYKNYNYSTIELGVNYKSKKIDLDLNIEDQYADFGLNGSLDLTNKDLPEILLSANVFNLELDKLNISPQKMSNSFLAFDLNANIVGSNADNLQGYFSIDSLTLYKDEKEFKLPQFLVKASGQSVDSSRRFEIKSDILSGYFEGECSFKTIKNNFSKTLSLYLPDLFTDNPVDIEDANKFKFSLDINNTETISDILKLPVTVYETAFIKGNYNNTNNNFDLEIKTPRIKAGGMKIYSGYLNAKTSPDQLDIDINVDLEGKNKIMNSIGIQSDIKNNTIKTNITLENTSANKAEGEFALLTKFDNLGYEKGIETQINIEKSKLLLNNINWLLEESSITLDKRLVAVDGFRLHTIDDKQDIKINGKYSKYDSSDILKVELQDFDLSYLFETLSIDALKFGGYATGSIFASSIEEKPYANTRLEVNEFQFQNTPLGNLNIFSELNDKTFEIALDGTLVDKFNKKTTIDGVIDPVNQKLSIDFEADSVNIAFLHAYTESILDKVSGYGTGKVRLYGDFSNVTVEGVANIYNGNVGIKLLNTDYTFSDVIYLRKGLIYFNDIEFKDKLGNKAFGNGKVVHNYFQDIIYHIEMNADNFLVYNVTEAQNPLFYGQVYGSGKAVVSGDEQEVDIEVNMKTNQNTLVRMNLMENQVNEYSFITYKEPESTTEDEDKISKADYLHPIITNSDMSVNMNFYIDATPDATIEIVMDPVGGDILKASGQGALQFIWSSKLAPQLFGNFNVYRGSYNFTFQRIMERKFTIMDGSTVQFRGDPFDAALDVKAAYRVTASLNDLDKDLVEKTGLFSIPVNCILNLTGPLTKPNINLDIEFPTANTEVARYIKSYMDTEDVINRQVAYLLLLSKFHTSEMGNVDHPSSDLAVMASATLSNQLSKIINHIDSRWQLGTHIRTSDAAFTSTEVELLLSSQLLNDRLLINGNFGYRDNPYVNKDAVVTDVDVEYLLNRSGTWRVKAYNHYNEKFFYMSQDADKTQQTQGVGILYRKDFDKLKELFNFKKKKLDKPNTEIHHVLPDSLNHNGLNNDFIKFK